MIHIDGDIKQATEIEDLIKSGTLYLTVPFGVRLRHFGGMNQPMIQDKDKSRFFTREYEVFGSPQDVKRVNDKSEKWMRDTILWLTRRNMNITFRYDYRTDKCDICVSCDSWQRLCRLIPQLKDKIRIIEPNKCEIIKQVAVV